MIRLLPQTKDRKVRGHETNLSTRYTLTLMSGKRQKHICMCFIPAGITLSNAEFQSL